jgi:hypothetical protein
VGEEAVALMAAGAEEEAEVGMEAEEVEISAVEVCFGSLTFTQEEEVSLTKTGFAANAQTPILPRGVV